MADRALDQGLEREGRDEAVERFVVEPDIETDPVPEAQSLELEVVPGLLLGEGDPVLSDPVQGEAEEPPELLDRVGGGARIRHQGGDRVQRVEQDVGMESGAQGFEPGAGGQASASVAARSWASRRRRSRRVVEAPAK